MSTQQDINAFRAQRIANTHDPLALMENTQTPFHLDHSSLITYMQHPQPNNNFVSQPSFNTNYLQHPMQNPGDISNPTTAFNMALALMAKAFTLNDTTPTNNNQRSSSNPSDQDRQMLMVEDNVGNQFRPNAMHNVGNQVVLNASQNPGVQNVGNQNGLNVVLEIANQHGDGNVVTAPAEGNSNGINALKDIEIKEGLKTKAYEISVLNQKHDELVKKSLLTRSQLEGYLKENTKVISDLKVKEEKDIDKMIEMDKQLKFLNEIADFSNIYDLLLEECVSKDVTCSYLHSLSDLNAYAELQCMYLHKVKECECLAQKLLKQTESVNKEVHNKLLKSFAKLENHSISLELALQQCKEQMKNNSVCKENGSNLKKLIEKCKGKYVETQFDKPSVVQQPNAQRIPKPSVLGKPTPFLNSPEMRCFQTKQSVNKTNVSNGLFKPVTQQNLPQNRKQAEIHSNVLKPGMYRITTNPHMSKSSGVNHTTSVSRPQLKCYQVKI
ncbi:hypothetical protein Tco_1190632, partial [Tanacetum coccineum]